MNLIIDIGNTLAKLVAFDGDTPVEEIKTSNETLERLPEFVNKYAFKQGIVGSVFGITAEAERQLKRLDFPLLYLNAQTPVPITNDFRIRWGRTGWLRPSVPTCNILDMTSLLSMPGHA